MHILIASNATIPVYAYGGTERVLWDLACALIKLGHRVTLMAKRGSSCPFAPVIEIDPDQDLRQQIPADVDIVHFHLRPDFDMEDTGRPYVFTQHGNEISTVPMPHNAIFVSRNHAQRFSSDQFVHNGLNWDAYGTVDFERARTHYHFLGNAAWRVKNVRGAIDLALHAGETLAVLGGSRFNFKRGLRFTWSRRIAFHGMVGGAKKLALLNQSRGLIFPVRWPEPFGLAIIESLYFGCPVFATPYGSLPELVGPECGVLSDSLAVLSEAIRHRQFDRLACHHYAATQFSADLMAHAYLKKYTQVIDGQALAAQRPHKRDDATIFRWDP